MTEELTAAVFPRSPSNAILSSVAKVQGQSLALPIAFATMALYTAERSEEDALVFFWFFFFVCVCVCVCVCVNVCVCVRERE